MLWGLTTFICGQSEHHGTCSALGGAEITHSTLATLLAQQDDSNPPSIYDSSVVYLIELKSSSEKKVYYFVPTLNICSHSLYAHAWNL